jgi:hypothetical protein
MSEPWQDYLMAFFAALFLVNGIPHFVHGVSGKQFPTPFSGGSGSLDGPVRNVFWAAFNFAVGGGLLWGAREALDDPSILGELAIAATLGAALLAYAFSHPRKREPKA